MERFVQRLGLAALWFSGSWLWATGSPSRAAEAKPAAPMGCVFDHPEIRRLPPCAPDSALGTARACPFEPLGMPTELSAWTDSASGEISYSIWDNDVDDEDQDEDEDTAPESMDAPANRFPLPMLADTPADLPRDGPPNGDVAYQLDPASGRQEHLSAADLLAVAPQARPWRDDHAVRFGWWGVSTQGVPTKVGEFQDLNSSAFWDIDRLTSNRLRTIDLHGTGLDRKGKQVGLNIFGPRTSVGVDYQRYLRRLDHDPLTNMTSVGNIMGDEIVSEDLNAGEDYAIRVHNVRTHVKGRLTKHFKYRVNFWLQRKIGDRQAISTEHCADLSAVGGGRGCHVLSQSQQIDWLTTKVEPVFEARVGSLAVEYSRPMRFFGQTDQVVTRRYGDFHSYGFFGDYPYGVVPENFTQTDRLKVAVDLPFQSHFYGRLHTENATNKNRDTNRQSHGLDFRLTSRFTSRLTLTSFARLNRQSNQFPPFLVDPEGNATSDTTIYGQPLFSSIVPQYGLRRPIDYSRMSFGTESNWRPFRWTDWAHGLAFNSGFEIGRIKRQFAVYQVQDPPRFVNQDLTPYASYFVGTSMKWTPTVDSFFRYKGTTTEDPLFGVNMYSGETNSSLPEQRNRFEFGGSWVPADNFIANVNIGIEDRTHDTDIADFDEESYPLTFTAWYAPTTRWSLSLGGSSFSNWIDQEIYFPSDTPDIATYDRRIWNYGGTGRVVNVGSSFAWTPRVSLSGGVELVWARNAVSPPEPWPDLPQYFDVVVDRTRVTGGVDWWFRDGISGYFRYVYDDYDDKSVTYNSGRAHMVLAGFSVLY